MCGAPRHVARVSVFVPVLFLKGMLQFMPERVA
jgi:hypothetical protein